MSELRQWKEGLTSGLAWRTGRELSGTTVRRHATAVAASHRLFPGGLHACNRFNFLMEYHRYASLIVSADRGGLGSPTGGTDGWQGTSVAETGVVSRVVPAPVSQSDSDGTTPDFPRCSTTGGAVARVAGPIARPVRPVGSDVGTGSSGRCGPWCSSARASRSYSRGRSRSAKRFSMASARSRSTSHRATHQGFVVHPAGGRQAEAKSIETARDFWHFRDPVRQALGSQPRGRTEAATEE